MKKNIEQEKGLEPQCDLGKKINKTKEELEKELNTLKDIHTKYLKTLNDPKHANDQGITKRVKEIEESIETKKTELGELIDKRDELKPHKYSETESAKKEKETIIKLEKKLTELTDSYTVQKLKLEKELRQNNSEIQELNEALATLEKQVAKEKEEKLEQSKLALCETEKLQDEIKEYKEKLDTLFHDNKREKEGLIRELETEKILIDKLTEELETEKSEIKGMSKLIGEKEKAYKTIESKIQQLQEVVNQENLEEKQEQEKLKEKLKELKLNNVNIEQEKERMERVFNSELESLDKKYQLIYKESQLMHKELKAKNLDIKRLEEVLTKQSNDYKELQAENINLATNNLINLEHASSKVIKLNEILENGRNKYQEEKRKVQELELEKTKVVTEKNNIEKKVNEFAKELKALSTPSEFNIINEECHDFLTHITKQGLMPVGRYSLKLNKENSSTEPSLFSKLGSILSNLCCGCITGPMIAFNDFKSLLKRPSNDDIKKASLQHKWDLVFKRLDELLNKVDKYNNGSINDESRLYGENEDFNE